MENLKCLRCGADMEFSRREQFQLGLEGGSVLTAESILLDIYKCPECGKVEFFEPGPRRASVPPKTNWSCSACGTYNMGRVNTCQNCGVTRTWSDAQRNKE